MRTAIWLASVCVGSWLVVGCGGEAIDSPDDVTSDEQPIIGGRRDLRDPSVVALVASDGSLVCSGAVISRRSVLTAAHCLGGAPNIIPPGSISAVLVGSDIQNAAPPFPVIRAPEFDTLFDPDHRFDGHDIGCVRLEQDIGVPALPYNREALGVGRVRVVGFGDNTHTGRGRGRKRTATTRLVNSPANLNPTLLAQIGTSNRQQCLGDSGGPAFQTIDGEERIIGLASFTSPPRRGRNCFDGDFNTRVDAYQEFIDRCACTTSLRFDSLPSVQGWSYVPTLTSGSESSIFSVVGGALVQNSLGIGDNAAPHYELHGIVDPTAPFTLSVRARVLQDEFFRENECGFTIGASTDAEDFIMCISSRGLEDQNGTFFNPIFDATQFHDYRLEGTPGGGGYRFLIDGALAASGTSSPLFEPPRTLLFGDASQNNAQVEITKLSYCLR